MGGSLPEKGSKLDPFFLALVHRYTGNTCFLREPLSVTFPC